MKNLRLSGSRSEPLRFGATVYETGQRYSKEDLLSDAQEDAWRSTPDRADSGKDFWYVFEMIPRAEAISYMREWLGDQYSEELADPEIGNLAREIARDGLQSPPLGTEGFHRIIAMIKLGWDIPYVRMIDKREGRGLEFPMFPVRDKTA